MFNAYIAQLPNGLDSYPEFTSKASLMRNALTDRPVNKEDTFDFPNAIQELLLSPPPVSTWIPTVHFFLGMHAMADIHGLNNSQYREWQVGLARSLYRKPLYRFLMIAASPRRLMQGMTNRWGTFHKGIGNNAIDHGDNTFLGELIAPSTLLNGQVLGFLDVFCVAIEESGGKNVRSEVVSESDERVKYRLSWK